MLTLSRKTGESVCIGPDVRVYIARVRGGKVELNINAPADVAVNRGEVAEEKGILVPLMRRNVDGRSGPPSGVFKDGYLIQMTDDRLIWSESAVNPSFGKWVDVSDVVSWRFAHSDTEVQQVRVGSKAGASR